MSVDRYRLTTVRQVLDYYMEHRGNHAESWQDLVYMTNLFIEFFGNKRLDAIRPEHITSYNNARRAGRLGKRPAKSSGTLLRELTHLQTAINYCERAKLVDPTHTPYIPMPDKPEPRDRWLRKDEIDQLRANVVPFSRADTFIRIALATGARKSMIEKLRWDQVCLQTNLIDFQKGHKKTKKRRPTVPIRSDLREYLELLRRRQIEEGTHGEYVLVQSSDIRWCLDAVVKRARLDGVTPHVLRHTYATHASMNGVPLTEIARILGDTIATVERVYAKFQPGYLQGAMEKSMV